MPVISFSGFPRSDVSPRLTPPTDQRTTNNSSSHDDLTRLSICKWSSQNYFRYLSVWPEGHFTTEFIINPQFYSSTLEDIKKTLFWEFKSLNRLCPLLWGCERSCTPSCTLGHPLTLIPQLQNSLYNNILVEPSPEYSR